MPTKKITEEFSFYACPTLTSMQRLAYEGKDIPDMKLLFGCYIPEDCLIHFPSPRGVGKSWLCMQLCIAIAGQWDSYLGETINHFGNTLYINNELSEKIIRRRANILMSNAPFWNDKHATTLCKSVKTIFKTEQKQKNGTRTERSSAPE